MVDFVLQPYHADSKGDGLNCGGRKPVSRYPNDPLKAVRKSKSVSSVWRGHALRGFWQPGYHNVRKRLRPCSFASPALAGFALGFVNCVFLLKQTLALIYLLYTFLMVNEPAFDKICINSAYIGVSIRQRKGLWVSCFF